AVCGCTLLLFLVVPPHPVSSLFPTRRSSDLAACGQAGMFVMHDVLEMVPARWQSMTPRTTSSLNPKSSPLMISRFMPLPRLACRSEEHTSELQSRENLVCRLLLEKKNLYCIG